MSRKMHQQTIAEILRKWETEQFRNCCYRFCLQSLYDGNESVHQGSVAAYGDASSSLRVSFSVPDASKRHAESLPNGLFKDPKHFLNKSGRDVCVGLYEVGENDDAYIVNNNVMLPSKEFGSLKENVVIAR